jgi:hypothetical protein
MSAGVNDFHPLLRAAIAEARAAGFGEAAAVLESKVLAAGTTSSELLGTVGAAIVEFLAATGPALPAHVADKLGRCLGEVRKVWPQL